MNVLIYQSPETAADCIAKLLTKRLIQQPDTVLGLATGGTMEPVYERLVANYRFGRMSFSEVRSFNLDEYVGLSPDHPCSFWRYMRQQLFDHVDIRPESTELPRGDTTDAKAEAARYEAAIVASGGIDLQILGLGTNGHIGFNEPPSDLSSLTHVESLTHATRQANARFFDVFDDVPRFAITMGVGTIMRADKIVLFAFGEEKAEVVARMIEGPVSAACPASVLQMHRQAIAVLDETAAAKLALRP